MPYKFIDLFAGIGGFRKGFEDTNLKCAIPIVRAIAESIKEQKLLPLP
jgi:hypothetical protein